MESSYTDPSTKTFRNKDDMSSGEYPKIKEIDRPSAYTRYLEVAPGQRLRYTAVESTRLRKSAKPAKKKDMSVAVLEGQSAVISDKGFQKAAVLQKSKRIKMTRTDTKRRIEELEQKIFGSSNQALTAMGVEVETSDDDEPTIIHENPVVSSKDFDPELHTASTTSNSKTDSVSHAAVALRMSSGGDLSLRAVSATVNAYSDDEDTNQPIRKAVWHDEDDDCAFETFSYPRAYQIGVAPGQGRMTVDQLKERREKQFEEAMGGQPDWSNLDKSRATRSDDEDEETNYLMTRTGDFIDKKNGGLTSRTLAYDPLEPANVAQKHRGSCVAVQFHKQSQVIMTAGMDHYLSFFQVDGKTNERIQSIKMAKDFLISQATLCCVRNEVVLTAFKRSDYCIYDMLGGKLTTVPKAFMENRSVFNRFVLSPDGKYMVVLGATGYIQVFSRKSNEMLYSVRMNGDVTCACFSSDSQNLFTYGELGDVYVWDMRRGLNCVHKFTDLGAGTGGTSIAVHSRAQYLACGSASGYVNLYNLKDSLTTPSPKVVKSFGNLLTAVDVLTFNSTGELLLSGSSDTDKAIRLANVASCTVFENFPGRNVTMSRPTAADFSPNSGYLALAEMTGWARLYRLYHYDSY